MSVLSSGESEGKASGAVAELDEVEMAADAGEPAGTAGDGQALGRGVALRPWAVICPPESLIAIVRERPRHTAPAVSSLTDIDSRGAPHQRARSFTVERVQRPC
jgi:hypothetical protein